MLHTMGVPGRMDLIAKWYFWVSVPLSSAFWIHSPFPILSAPKSTPYPFPVGLRGRQRHWHCAVSIDGTGVARHGVPDEMGVPVPVCPFSIEPTLGVISFYPSRLFSLCASHRK